MNKQIKKKVLYILILSFSLISIISFIVWEQKRPIISFIVLNFLCVIAAMRAVKDYI